jgi:hypothetical protein
MTVEYKKVWDSMNSLEMTATKISSAREILDSAINALENHKLDKAEALMYATSEFLEYFLQEFDEKFKVAWKETVVEFKNQPVVDPEEQPLNYTQMIEAGYTMTADGFWIKE